MSAMVASPFGLTARMVGVTESRCVARRRSSSITSNAGESAAVTVNADPIVIWLTTADDEQTHPDRSPRS